MKKQVSAIIATALLLFFSPMPSRAYEAHWGTEIGGFVTGSKSSRMFFQFIGDGGMGYLAASGESTAEPDMVHAQSDSELTETEILPLLSANATFFPTDWQGKGSAWAFAVEGYTLDDGDTEPRQFTLTATLTGHVTDPLESDTGLKTRIYIFNEELFEFTHDLDALINEIGATYKGAFELSLDSTVDNGSISDSITFTANPGETFYLWVDVTAIAEMDYTEDEASAITDDILVLSFDNVDGLTPQSSMPPSLSDFSSSFGSMDTDTNHNPYCDFDDDGDVDGSDLAVFSSRLGE